MNEVFVRVLEKVAVAYFNIVESKRIPFPMPPISGGEVICLEFVLLTRETSSGGWQGGDGGMLPTGENRSTRYETHCISITSSNLLMIIIEKTNLYN